ncbi:MAG: beta-ketoacyl synthase N-terminal-like domain-containing protein [Pseudomonadota bacterium]
MSDHDPIGSKNAAPNASTAHADIAIVGMACMFPGAQNLERFWSNILGQVSAIGEPLPEWGAERHYLPDDEERNRISTTAGGFLRDLYAFDSLEFGIMPNSVDGGEPDHFLALKIARDALVDAGYLEADHTKTGVILGHSTYLHRGNANVVQHGVVVDQTVELLRGLLPDAPEEAFDRLRQEMLAKLPPFNADIAPGLVPNVMTGRIANRLDLKGPNYIIDAACASSLLAVGAAIEELRRGESDLMIAGGVNASMPAEVLAVFTQLGALSDSNAPRPFDARADGTLLGEGLGAVVLKRLDDARRDGDRVYAVVKGVGHSSDGRALGLLAPNRDGEILAMQRAYRQTGVPVDSVGLLEAHGTGIPLGDKTEIGALTEVFGGREGRLPSAAIGSVKSMISHTIPAAGVAGLIKMALSLYHRTLPPTLCEEPNPALELEQTRFCVNTDTRPWVQAGESPRRAAVNAFGFGGINTHAVLEEFDSNVEAEGSALYEWSSELVVMSGEDREALVNAVDTVAADCDKPGVRLRDIAYTAAARADGGRQRLAIVATSIDDLRDKLERARKRLADRGRLQFQTRSGMYFSAQPLEGKVAFLFPGEGAQYHGMLSDLALAFPQVRQWFDFWDGIFAGQREFTPSSAVFMPPNGVTDENREWLESQLHTLRIGSESMFIANQAIFHLLKACGVTADVMVGHSSGENSALVASGMIRLEGQNELREHIRNLNRMYEPMESAGAVARGALLTVGAVPREDVQALIAESNGEVHLALDNCANQTVLFGAQEKMEEVAAELRRRGGLCVFLPFDRAYHTPLFAPVAEAVESFLQDVDFVEPAVPVYSCVNAAPFPAQADEKRHLAAVQWASTVKFVETVEQLYADGVRHFLEVGPSGNLTSFVDDILRDRPHVAASANSRSKPDLQVLQQLLGRLYAAGQSLQWDALYAGRHVARTDDKHYARQGLRPALPVANTLPYIRLDDDTVAELREVMVPRPPAALPQAPTNTPPTHTAVAPALEQAVMPTTEQPVALESDEASDLMRAHLGLMQDFLHQQTRVFDALGGTIPGTTVPVTAQEAPAEVLALTGPEAAPPAPGQALISRIVEHSETEVTAEFDFDLSRQRFLRHHVLYARSVSDLDPSLMALPVSPLSVSLEMLVEVAALLTDQSLVVALENVQAFNWVAVDAGTRTIRLRAKRGNSGARVRAWLEDEMGQLLVEGEVIFADAPLADGGLVEPLRSPRAPLWEDADLYTTGMFHGPLFHSVSSLLAFDDTGMDLRLADTPTAGFFHDEAANGFFLNPVLLDSIGHLTAFWLAQSLGTDFSSFPSSIGRIELLQAHREDTGDCYLRGRLGFLDGDASTARFLGGNFDCLDSEGHAVLRISGWRDRFFRVPHSFYEARTNPREGWFGEDWTPLFPEAEADAVVWYLPAFPQGFLEDAGAVWKRLLAFTVLSAAERAEWHELRLNPKQMSEWIVGRLALKEAVRYWLAQTEGLLLCPADITVTHDEQGRPQVFATGLDIQMPAVSLAHVGGMCLAAVTHGEHEVGVDLETLGRVELGSFLEGALTAAERALVAAQPMDAREDYALRLWCAKEAVAKSFGTGLQGRPSDFEVATVDETQQVATVIAHGRTVAVSVRRHEDKIVALVRGGDGSTLAA